MRLTNFVLLYIVKSQYIIQLVHSMNLTIVVTSKVYCEVSVLLLFHYYVHQIFMHIDFILATLPYAHYPFLGCAIYVHVCT